MSTSYAPTILNDTPVAYYRQDEIAGLNLYDQTLNAFIGLINSSGITYSQPGSLYNDPDTAMKFDGSAGYATLPSALKTDGWSACSFEIAVKLTNNTFSTYPCLIANDYPGSSNNGLQLYLAPSTDGNSGYFTLGNGTSHYQIAFGTGVLAPGGWNHIVATYDGSTMSVYLNGARIASGSASGTIGTAAYPISIARYPGDSGYLPATTDEIAIYNYALTPAQVANHFIVATTGGMSTSRSFVQLLINDVYYPTIRQETIQIDRTANDPIPTVKFTLQDDPSNIAISELMEILFIDAGQIANPAHNLLLNPAMSPYNTNWTPQTVTGGTITQYSGGGATITMSNATGTAQIYQQSAANLYFPGQTYCLSATISTTACTNCSPFLSLVFFSANNITLGQQNISIPSNTSATRYSVQGLAPAGTTYLWVGLGISKSSGTNSGSATYTQIQLEPTSFSTGYAQLSYPTPWCANGQPNCTVMPDGTTIRQYRLFGGYITKATAGRYIGNNRQWSVQASGYAWLLQKQQLNNSWSNHTDSYIIGQIVSQYFPQAFSTTQVATGTTLSAFAYAYNGSARDAFDALAANANFMYYIDAYRVIWYQPPGYSQIGFQLSDQPDNMTSFPYYNYTKDVDGTQIGNVTLVTGASGISAIEYDAQSIAYYNLILGNNQGTFWRTVNDSTITTTAAAQQRAIGENATYNYALDIIHLSTQQIMIPGYTVLVTSSTDQIYETPFLIQKSSLVLKGFKSLQQAVYEFVCDLGVFLPDLVNITVKMLRKQQITTNSIGTPVLGLMLTDDTTYTDSVQVTRIIYNPSIYGTGVYGVNTYYASFPSVPTTQYGVGVYGDTSHGYN